MKILLVGGGTLGSVNPLIAVYEEGKKSHPDWQWFWIGTKHGPERALARSYGIQYEWLPAAKWRRYFSGYNLIVPFLLLIAFFRTCFIMMSIKPNAVLTVGSFLAVPVVWAAWLWRKKIIIHQQDIRPGLANKMSAPLASRVTVSFEPSLRDYPRSKTEWIGNPVRPQIEAGRPEQAKALWGLDDKYPTILIMGGSSGAQGINRWAWSQLDNLTRLANVIHLTGVGKSTPNISQEHYWQIEFLGADLAHALAAADVVIARAGIATLSELAALGKAAVLIPLPATHQEENARYFTRAGAALAIAQNELGELTVNKISQLLSNLAERIELARNIGLIMKRGARARVVEILSEWAY